MTRISPSPGQKIIYLLIFLGGVHLYVDINTNFQNINNGFSSFKTLTLFVKSSSL